MAAKPCDGDRRSVGNRKQAPANSVYLIGKKPSRWSQWIIKTGCKIFNNFTLRIEHVAESTTQVIPIRPKLCVFTEQPLRKLIISSLWTIQSWVKLPWSSNSFCYSVRFVRWRLLFLNSPNQILVLFYKKGEKSHFRNYRGTMFFLITSKILFLIIPNSVSATR